MKTINPANLVRGRLLAAVALAFAVVATAHADYQSTVLADTPLAYYPINSSVDPTGTTATDLSGNGNNGTYNGTDPEFNTVPGPSDYLPNALYFDGFTSYVDLSTGGNPGLLNFSGPITMEAWVQPASSSVGGSTPADILGKGYDSSASYNEIALRCNGGYYYGGTYQSTNAPYGGHAQGGTQTTDWIHLVSTYDGTNWNLYINSQLVSQGSGDTVGSINFSAPWRIGTGSADGANRYFSGNLTQVALYTNALTPAQVLNHFCVGEVGTPASSSVPIIIAQPQPQSAAYGGTATFSVGTVSALSTTNQWFKNDVAMPDKTNATLTLTGVGTGDDANYRVVVGNSNGTTNSVTVSLTVVAANSLKWNSANTSGVWDTASSANWLDVSNSTQTVFNTFDQVLFDDTVGVSNTVSISGSVAPSVITVDSSTNNFVFTGTGPLSGSSSLVKKGSSTLTLNVPVSGFTGPVTISGGKVLAGYYAFANSSSITITNNSTLDFNGSTMANGTPITVSGSGVGGAGAIVNSVYELYGQVLQLNLAGDTTIGGGTRWDFGAGSTLSGPHKLTLSWASSGNYAEWNALSVATNVGDIELAIGKLGIKSMTSSFGNPNSNLIVDGGFELDFWDGGCNRSLHILNNGKVQIFTSPTPFNASNVTLEDNAQLNVYGGSGSQLWSGTITLNGTPHLLIGDADRVFTNVISGPGGFVWDGWNHQMILSASNTYAGPTVIGDGPQVALNGNGSISHSGLIFFGGSNPSSVHIDVSGRTDKTLTLAGGQTLGGIGTINGSLIVASGATLAPAGTNTTIGITAGANATGVITATNAVTLLGTTTLKLNGSGVNDQVQAGAGLTFGGTLNLVNISGSPLANGNSFQVFNAASYSGSFASITPATPGAGLAWDTNQLSTLGFISVVTSSGSGPVIGTTTVSGGNLIFSGTGGPANGSYAVLTTTNLTTPIASWTSILTNNFDGTGAFNVTNAIAPGTPQEFYRIKQLP